MTWRKTVAGLALLAVTGVAGTAGFQTRKAAHELVTNPVETRRVPARTPASEGLVFDDVEIRSEDGLRLVAWFVPPRNGAVVILQHGYKSSRGEMLNEAAMLHRRGYGSLIPALRAHDMSEGELITFGHREVADLERWYQFARTAPGVAPARVAIIGNSMGGALAIELAARTPGIRAVVTNSAFSSLTDTLEASVRFFTGMRPFPFAPMIAFWAERETGATVKDLDATRVIGRISPRPVLLMQGGADEVISIESGQRLFDAAGEPRELWFDPQVGHARFDSARAEEYQRRVLALFEKYLSPSIP